MKITSFVVTTESVSPRHGSVTTKMTVEIDRMNLDAQSKPVTSTTSSSVYLEVDAYP